MGSDNVAFAGATRIAADLARGAYSSRDIVDLFISRIERFDGDINAVVVRRFEEARREADAAEREAGGCADSGTPSRNTMTMKECFDFTGLPSTSGHPELAGTRAAADAVTVARLRGAGAIVLGKTNVPLDLADWETHNEIYGHTRNPWDLGRSAGGSSGGSAAALAAGLCSLELGSDIAGSIRTPATFCGVYGHKPTFGVLPIRGANNPDPALGLRALLLVAGPLGQFVPFDLEMAFDIMAGRDVDDGAVWEAVLSAKSRDRLRGWRIAIVADDPTFRVDGSIRNAII